MIIARILDLEEKIRLHVLRCTSLYLHSNIYTSSVALLLPSCGIYSHHLSVLQICFLFAMGIAVGVLPTSHLCGEDVELSCCSCYC